eukprot:COSAG05_NODE_25378_length_197_cov_57.071429_1_plen_44_part_01
MALAGRLPHHTPAAALATGMDDAQTARLVEFEETGYVVLPGALT